MDCSMPSFPVLHYLLEFAQTIESVMSSNHLILCYPLFLLPSIFPSIRVFSNDSALHIRWPKYWSFSINPFKEYSGLISFRIDWFDILAVQGTLKSLLQYHSSKISIHRCWVQHSHPYITTRKTIALTIQTFVGKVMALLFYTLSRFITAFLPRRMKHFFLSSGVRASVIRPLVLRSLSLLITTVFFLVKLFDPSEFCFPHL